MYAGPAVAQSTVPDSGIRRRSQDIEQVATGGGQPEVACCRPGHQQRRITHQPSVVDDVGERLLPRFAEKDGVMADVITHGATSDMGDDR